jgi:hypothetical protein
MDMFQWAVSIGLPVVSGISSYILAARKAKQELEQIKEQNKHDLLKLMNQHKLDLEAVEKRHQLEMDAKDKEHLHKMELIEREHKYELERKEREQEGTAKYNAMSQFMNSPQIQEMIMKQLGGLTEEK